jgi:hypothetical protein
MEGVWMMYYVGLDMGQKQDYSAVAVIDRVDVSKGRDQWNRQLFETQHHVVHLARFQIGTDYTEIVGQTRKLLETPQLRGRARLIVDATGVGVAVYDLLVKARLSPVGITITGGNEVKITDKGSFNVPKKDLIARLQVLLEQGRVKVANSLPEAGLLVEELQTFGSRTTEAGNEVFGNFRVGSHDDLVLAICVAVWYADQYGSSGFVVKKRQEKSPIEEAFRW